MYSNRVTCCCLWQTSEAVGGTAPDAFAHPRWPPRPAHTHWRAHAHTIRLPAPWRLTFCRHGNKHRLKRRSWSRPAAPCPFCPLIGRGGFPLFWRELRSSSWRWNTTASLAVLDFLKVVWRGYDICTKTLPRQFDFVVPFVCNVHMDNILFVHLSRNKHGVMTMPQVCAKCVFMRMLFVDGLICFAWSCFFLSCLWRWIN